jgi:hypothetical protein
LAVALHPASHVQDLAMFGVGFYPSAAHARKTDWDAWDSPAVVGFGWLPRLETRAHKFDLLASRLVSTTQAFPLKRRMAGDGKLPFIPKTFLG